jgi:hypothetical protein
MAQITLDQVTRMADQLSTAEKRRLVEHLTHQIERPIDRTAPGAVGATATRPQSLRGIWQSAFPDDLDINAVLDEIRGEWQMEWPEVFNR